MPRYSPKRVPLPSGLVVEEKSQRPGACESARGEAAHQLIVQLVDAPGTVQRWAKRERAHPLRAGDLSLVPADTPLRWAWGGSTTSLHLWIEPAALGRAAHALWGAGPGGVELWADRFRFADLHLLHLARSIREEQVSGWPGGRLRLEDLADRLAVHLLGHHSNLGRPAAGRLRPLAGRLSLGRLNTALEYLEAHLLDGDVSLAALAGAVGVDRFWFARLFRRSTGLAPHQYVLGRRVERAKALLRATDLPLAQVAALAGFADQAHLHRHFRRWVGVTPGAFPRPSRLGLAKNVQDGWAG